MERLETLVASRTVKMVARDYDVLTPLLNGDVQPEGIELRIDRAASIGAFREEETFQAGEMSFSQYVRRLDAGDDDIIGLPVFLMRGFRQRCFFTRRGSGLSSFQELRGKRVGTNGWPDSGNTWSRSLLRAEGVGIDEIDWFVGPIDGVTDQALGHRFSTDGLPGNVQAAPEGKSLVGMVAAGELDAMMVPWPPRNFYEPDSPVVRLLPDYQRAEEEYARRVGFCPTHHILGVRASVLEEDPWIAGSLFRAFEEARKLTEERRWVLTDASPWLLPDLERTAEILGRDWQANGVSGNEAVIETFCAELHAQGITGQRIALEAVFAEFQRLTSSS
jgi:4,5-dihydroxyphthalate decarboxylase